MCGQRGLCAVKFVQHPSNNGVFGAPDGWDQKQLPCGALPVTHTTADSIPAVVSFWKPSPEELAALNAGEHVVLWVIGGGMPPVAIEVRP